MKLTEWLLKMKDGVTAPLSKVSGAVDDVAAKFDSTQSKISNIEERSNKVGSSFGKWIIGGALIGGLSLVGTKIFELTAQQQKYKAVLTNSFGSADVATGAMDMLKEFATKTPFTLDEITGSFIKMVNRGMLPTQAELMKLGDLASTSGKGMDQLVEAMLDAQTGEFERLKEFGVKTKVAGDKVSFTFKEQTTTIDNTAEAINKYLIGLGEVKGVSGAMNAQMATLGGKVSNLQDNFANLLITVGQKLAPAIGLFLDGLNALISNGPLLGDILTGVTAGVIALSAGWLLLNGATLLATISTWSLNAAMTANPLGAVIILVTAVVTAIMYFWRTSEKFRGALTGLWESIKQVFQNIRDAAVSYLGGVGEILMGIFDFDGDKIKSGFKKVFEGLKGVTVGIGEGVGEKFQQGYEDGAAKVRSGNAGKVPGKKNPYDALAEASAASRGAKSAKALKGATQGISAGGSSIRNVTVNIDSLIKNFTLNAKNLKEGMAEVKTMSEEQLVRAINGAENAVA